MGKADKKQRHRAKREAKRREIRRKGSISPLKRLADAPGEVEYWISADFDLLGQSQIFVYKRAAGLSGVACFLVDQGVVGLKDAWSRIGIERSEFERMLETCNRQGIPMQRTDLSGVRRMILGGIRWAHESGMRLPKDLAKTASLVGGVDGWAVADVSNFVMEFAGHPLDLQQRLIGQRFEEYITRDDVSFTFSDSAPFKDQRTGDYIDFDDADGNELDDAEESALDEMVLDEESVARLSAQFLPAVMDLTQETQTWLVARNETASVELFEGWMTVLLARLLSRGGMPDAIEQESADFGFEHLGDLALRLDPIRRTDHDDAVRQVLAHLATDPQKIQNSVLKYQSANEPSAGP